MEYYQDKFEKMYDAYSDVVYGIALEIALTEIEAEQIVIGTFVKLHNQNLINTEGHNICPTIIKLTIQTACEELKIDGKRELKYFARTCYP